MERFTFGHKLFIEAETTKNALISFLLLQSYLLTVQTAGAVVRGQGAVAAIHKYSPLWPPKCSVRWLYCAMFVLVTSLCLAFSVADIEFHCFNHHCIQL